MPAGPRPPGDLEAAGRRLWTSVQATFELRGDELPLLTLACQAADRCAQLSAAIEAEGLTEESSQGRRVNVMLTEWRAMALVYARLMASLRLPDDVEGELEGSFRRPQRRGAARGPQRMDLG